MLSQEFALPDVLRIWDSLLADETRSDFLIDVCTAMVLVIREDILTNDFADNVKLLQVKFYSFAITFSKKKLYPFFVCNRGPLKVLNDVVLILNDQRAHFKIIQNIQRSPNIQTKNWYSTLVF